MQAPVSFFEKNINRSMFIGLHLSVLLAFFVHPTYLSFGLCIAFWILRMFGITAGYHRLLSHRSYATSRFMRFLFAFGACSAMQKGPLDWVARHRKHHRNSDKEGDPHSPVINTVWWAHVGWILANEKVDLSGIKDLLKSWELRLLDRFHWVPGLCLAGICFLLDGLSGIVWGFLVSTIMVYHCTFLVNSACHLLGRKRYDTGDESRNNWWVAIVTLGEGWHNNHHYYQSSARQGFFWWEIDISYYVLCVFRWFGLVWDLRKPAAEKLKDIKKSFSNSALCDTSKQS